MIFNTECLTQGEVLQCEHFASYEVQRYKFCFITIITLLVQLPSFTVGVISLFIELVFYILIVRMNPSLN